MASFGISSPGPPLVKFWRTLVSRLGIRRNKTEASELVSELSYEEAEANYDDAVRGLVDTLQNSTDAKNQQTRILLDNAVHHACRMNELCGGSHGPRFKKNLRKELFLTCCAAASNADTKSDVNLTCEQAAQKALENSQKSSR